MPGALKGHTYLHKPVVFNCMTFQWTPETKRLIR